MVSLFWGFVVGSDAVMNLASRVIPLTVANMSLRRVAPLASASVWRGSSWMVHLRGHACGLAAQLGKRFLRATRAKSWVKTSQRSSGCSWASSWVSDAAE